MRRHRPALLDGRAEAPARERDEQRLIQSCVVRGPHQLDLCGPVGSHTETGDRNGLQIWRRSSSGISRIR